MEELIRELKEESEKKMAVAISLRTEAPGTSFSFFKMSELMMKAAEELQKQIPQDIEIEGGGYTWWHVCPECHGAIDSQDKFCKHCGQAVKNENGRSVHIHESETKGNAGEKEQNS